MKLIIKVVSVLILLLSVAWQVDAITDKEIQYKTDIKVIELKETDQYEEEIKTSFSGSINESTYEIMTNPYKERLDMIDDYVGWISLEGSQIDYPIVRGDDNLFYLDRNPFKEYSKAGSIFMDRRNVGIGIDDHVAIYGHNMKDGSMFSALNNYLDINFFENNKIITIENLYGERSFEVVAAYYVTADDYILPFEINQDIVKDLMNQSIHPVPEKAYNAEKLLTLSTCNYILDNGRMIVHAIPVE